jgi:two-component system OmpR family response regulator
VQLLLVDDDIVLSAMLKEYLEVENFIVDTVFTGKAGIDAALTGVYDAIVLDIMLPDMSGIAVLRAIRKTSKIPIIMLTAKGDNIDRVIGLELGADDYVPKPCYPRELVARLRAVLRRTHDMPSLTHESVLTLNALSLFPAQHKVEWEHQDFELTLTEFKLLEILLNNKECVVSKNELSVKVMGRRREIYDRSIDVHISNLRLKLQNVAKNSITIETVRGVGYRIKQRS